MTWNRQNLTRHFWIWKPQDRKTAILGFFIALIALLYFIITILINRNFFMKMPYQDFFALWSASKATLIHGAASLYDSLFLHNFRISLGMPSRNTIPFPYPPSFILVIYPLGFFTYYAAYAIWITLTFTLYFLAVVLDQPRKKLLISGIILAPATAACLGVGQSAFLSAAVFIAGARLVRSRPIAAGILFGLMAFKPQFGILVPLALLAAGKWRCITAALVTIGCVAALTAIAFGSSIWLTWWAYLSHFTRVLYAPHSPSAALIFKMPTVLANLRVAGAPPSLARDAQIIAALIGMAAVWIAWRRFRQIPAIIILLAATWLTTPYAFIYDMPALAAAVILFAADRLERTGALNLLEIIVITATLAIPILQTSTLFHPPIGAALIAGFVALAFATFWHDRQAPCAMPGEPPVTARNTPPAPHPSFQAPPACRTA